MLEDLKKSMASLIKCRRALNVAVFNLQSIKAAGIRPSSGAVKHIVAKAFVNQGFNKDEPYGRARFDRFKTVDQALAVLEPALAECNFAARKFREAFA